MSNIVEDQQPDYVADSLTGLGHPATNPSERRITLEWCLKKPWANEDIGRLERLDSGDDHGWKMWKWKP